jgi:23S rRNA-/tRNA-specific pseudouridylate synthase
MHIDRSGPETLFRDERLVILNKPAGLASHAGPRGGPSVEDWFPALSRRKDGPWLAHRLDADTAGCLVVALRKAPLVALQAAFAAGRVRKTYWAICEGAGRVGQEQSGLVESRLLRQNSKAGWRMVADPAGQDARTGWRIMGRSPQATWIELTPRTGRTHQVRAHCAALGLPVLGDLVYGDGRGPLRLLARAISLPLEPPASAEAPVPPHMRAELEACGWRDALSPSGTRP